jgi:hypothetical protein
MSTTYFSQFGEDEAVLGYFDGFVGSLLDIGAFDGLKFSNSRNLILGGWNAVLVEPGVKAFASLLERYAENPKVELIHAAVVTERIDCLHYIWEREEYTTLCPTMRDRAPGYWLVYRTGGIHPKALPEGPHHFVSIDTDGNSIEILEALDLTQIDARLVCVEYNSILKDRERILRHCSAHGLGRTVLDTSCNLVVGR